MPSALVVLRTLSRLTVLPILLWAVTTSITQGQLLGENDISPTTNFVSRPAPLHHVYWHLLRYQRHLDQKAALLEQQGQSREGQAMRAHLQNKLHFSNAQIAVLREVGLQMEKDVAAVEAKAMPIIYQDRAWLKLNGPSAGHPPGHSQVHALQEEREAVIKNAVDELNRRLGPTAAAQLQARIEKEWAPLVTVRPLSDPQTHDPKIDSKTSAPFHLEAQR